MQTKLDAALAGRDLDGEFVHPIWNEWNAKSPDAKVADGLAADRALLDRFDALSDTERARLLYSVAPGLTVDFAGLVQLRLNEHALHTWDVEVVLDPNATIPVDAASLVVDNLAMMVGWSGKPTGVEHEVQVHTVDPARDFTLVLGAAAVSLAASPPASMSNRVVVNLELPAEALIRLVYGRLDPQHSPPVRGDADLDELRRAFPGV